MNNERILIVEDEKIIAIDLQRRLERFGYEVVGMAGDGDSAIRLARELEPDIILMDIMLIGALDGIETAKDIRATQDIPFIFLTAYTDEKTIERAKVVGPYGYILKPFKERELYTTIDIALYKHGMEKKLTHQERLFSAILHSINDGIVATDTNMNVLFLNPIAEGIIGMREDELKGKTLTNALSLFDGKTQKDILGGGIPLIGDRPLFFSDIPIKNCKGKSFILDGSVTRIHERENTTEGFVIALNDKTEMQRLSETLSFQSSHDSLTGLSNREEFSYKLGEVIKSARVTGGSHALIILNVDRFKTINETCGPIAGDELLRMLANRILSSIQRQDISARLSADEFGILLTDCGPEACMSAATRIQESIQGQKFAWQGTNYQISVSIGVLLIDRESGDVQSAVASADDALQFSKESGGNHVTVFQPQDAKFAQRRGDMEWIGKINKAIEENRFILYYQTIVPLVQRSGLGPKLEILIRLVNNDGSIDKPADFIPPAERYNLMPQIDRWVVENTFRSFRILKDKKSPLAEYMFSLNLSGPSLLDDSLVEMILDELGKYSLDAGSFCFEITETSAIQNLSHASRFIGRLKAAGFTFALDDFGAGFSSFGYLRNLPVDFLKIDGSFVQNIDENAVSLTMVDSINSIGHVMGLRTIAEFVRNDKIRMKLEELGVDYGQGYFFSEPRPVFE